MWAKIYTSNSNNSNSKNQLRSDWWEKTLECGKNYSIWSEKPAKTLLSDINTG